MTKIAEHHVLGNECVETVHLYSLTEDDFWDIEDKDEKTVLADLGFYEDPNPMPGAFYSRYECHWTTTVLVVIEHTACNC